MARNYVQSTAALDVVAPFDLIPGDPVQIGNGIFGVSITRARSGSRARIATDGVWRLPKQTGVIFSVGAEVYWNEADRVAAPNAGLFVGIAVSEAGSAAGEVVTSVIGNRMSSTAIAAAASGIAASGLTLSVAPFSHDDFDYPGGKITALPNLTQYLGVNLHTKRLHTLPRMGDQGTLFLAKVGTDATSIIEFKPIERRMPSVPLAGVLRKLRNGVSANVSVLGSSLLDGAHASKRHVGLIFASTDIPYGYSALQTVRDTAFSTDTSNFVSMSAWAGGSPAGYGQFANGGPDGLACLEWRPTSSGRLFISKYTGGAGIYSPTMRAVGVGAGASIRLQVKDANTDTIRGDSGVIALTDTAVTINASGTTQTSGYRIEIVATGTVRMNQFNVDMGASATVSNAAVGGSQAQYAFALMGHSVQPYVANAWVNESGVVMTPQYRTKFATTPNQAAWATSNLRNVDLIIVGMLANGGTDRDMFHESLMRKCRESGAEVLVVSDNPQSPNAATNPSTWGLYPDGGNLARLAAVTGCAFADTAAYVAEAFLRGLPVYADTIHMSSFDPAGASAPAVASGHECWAEALAGVLSATAIRSHAAPALQPRIVDSGQVPGRADVFLAPTLAHHSTASTSPSVLEAGPEYNNNICTWFGVPADRRCRKFPVGSVLSIFHPMSTRVGLIVFGNDFTAELRVSGGASVNRTINFSADAGGIRTTYIEIDSPTNMGVLAAPGYAAIGRSLHITAGEAWIQALVVLTPDYEDVTNEVLYLGTWASESTSGFPDMTTDTVGAQAVVQSRGAKSMAFVCPERAGGGEVDFYSDEALYASNSVTGASHFRTRRIEFANFGAHKAMLQLKTAGSGGAAGARSLNVMQAFAIKDR